jgi:hypothetical protein
MQISCNADEYPYNVHDKRCEKWLAPSTEASQWTVDFLSFGISSYSQLLF